jgi:hypothetical protein
MSLYINCGMCVYEACYECEWMNMIVMTISNIVSW